MLFDVKIVGSHHLRARRLDSSPTSTRRSKCPLSLGWTGSMAGYLRRGPIANTGRTIHKVAQSMEETAWESNSQWRDCWPRLSLGDGQNSNG